MDYAALAAELIAGHPTTGAYDADSAIAAGQLNTVNRPHTIPSMSGKQLMDNTDATEYDALSDVKKSQWLAFTGHDEVDTSVGGMGQTVGIDVFGAGSQTATNIADARSTTISRAQELEFGYVSPGDVEYARAL